MQAVLEDVFVSDALERYIVALTQATRSDPRVALGASPRGSLAVLKLARAEAAIRGRDFVLPDDVKAVAVAALAHRLVLHRSCGCRGRRPAQGSRACSTRFRPGGIAVSWRPTVLNVSFLTLAGWRLFLGVLTGRADLVVVAVPLIVALIAARRTRRRSGAAPLTRCPPSA